MDQGRELRWKKPLEVIGLKKSAVDGPVEMAIFQHFPQHGFGCAGAYRPIMQPFSVPSLSYNYQPDDQGSKPALNTPIVSN